MLHEMEKAADLSTGKKSISIQEDWVIVLLGLLIIFLSLFLFTAPAPAYGWKSGDELLEKVFSVSNILAVVIQFILMYLIGILATFTTKKVL